MNALVQVALELGKELIGLVRDFRDPVKQRELFRLSLDKKARNAIDTAQKICFVIDDLETFVLAKMQLRDQKDKGELKTLFKKFDVLKKTFFKYDQ